METNLDSHLKDFNFLWKADFDKTTLSSKEYQDTLIKYCKLYKEQDKSYLEFFFESHSYLPLHTNICFISLLSNLQYTMFKNELISVLKNNEDIIKSLFIQDIELADEILQLYESIKIECKFLIPVLSVHYQWIQEYGQEICNRDYGL